MSEPTVGRILHYRLTAEDAEKARAMGGNPHDVGQIVPFLAVRIWPNEYPNEDPEPKRSTSGVNGQAFLDSEGSLWITSAKEGFEPGCWSWPQAVK